jgi:hypothetical protein
MVSHQVTPHFYDRAIDLRRILLIALPLFVTGRTGFEKISTSGRFSLKLTRSPISLVLLESLPLVSSTTSRGRVLPCSVRSRTFFQVSMAIVWSGAL